MKTAAAQTQQGDNTPKNDRPMNPTMKIAETVKQLNQSYEARRQQQG